ncbi:MAG: ethanolamine ammonia-lyase [Ruminococcaceae bacterium]|nr:ethanolamine ammonia-lyase [Oscillospiraceae bacterium]
MSERLRSVGLDVGTTTTQLVVSELEIENRAGSFSVPEMQIGERRILYQSPVYFTPLKSQELVDGESIRQIVLKEYEKAGIRRDGVDTGAVIITGETSRKENAASVLEALAELAGDFVVATAGPDLESVLAAKGAGAVEYSRQADKPVLHIDIGGGTSNLALMAQGKILATGCLNVGGRLVKFDENKRIYYVSPVLEKLCKLKIGDRITIEQAREVARILVQALEMAVGRREKGALLEMLTTRGTAMDVPKEEVIVSFSGGVADCIREALPWDCYGDLGPILGQQIAESTLCRGEHWLAEQTIRATVIGAGCHSAQLSGSTVFHKNVEFPLKNRPVVNLTAREQALPEKELALVIATGLERQDSNGVLALPGLSAPDYGQIKAFARAVAAGFGSKPVLVAVEQDMAKALGQAISMLLAPGQPCLCVDRVRLTEGSYLDVAMPVGPCLPVVVKTLILER